MRSLLVSLVLLAFSISANAERGRYEAIALSESAHSMEYGAMIPKVLILDTELGHLWTWSEHELSSENGSPRYGPALLYHGQVKVGDKAGVTIDPTPSTPGQR